MISRMITSCQTQDVCKYVQQIETTLIGLVRNRSFASNAISRKMTTSLPHVIAEEHIAQL